MNRSLLFGIVLLLISYVFVGVYKDDEFFESELFIKYPPTTKLFFHSPIGQSDAQLKDLTDEQKEEEVAFQKYIIKRNIQSNNQLCWLAYLLVVIDFCFILWQLKKIIKKFLFQ